MTGFMEADLVVWIQTFWTGDTNMSYEALMDGVFLNTVFKQIDSNAQIDSVIDPVEEIKDRLQNWDNLLQNIHTYYTNDLQQVIVMQPPNILLISRSPESIQSQEEVEKALLLILGAAVQCERKDHFIRQMLTTLQSETVQSGIMACIKEVTESCINVIGFSQPEDLEKPILIDRLRAVSAQRDKIYIEEVKDILSHMDGLQQQVSSLQGQLQVRGGPASVTQLQDKHHLGVELAECKAKLRRLRAELEEKSEQMAEVVDEADSLRSELSKTREEVHRLAQEACQSRALRDEVDCLREKASQADRWEAENSRLKERLHEAEFYKGRCQELREDLAVIVDERSRLVDTMEKDKKLVEAARDTEVQLAKITQELEKVKQEREYALERVYELAEDVSRLEAENRGTLNESANLGAELERARDALDLSSASLGSLSDQLSDTANARILRLEVECRRLKERSEEAERQLQLGGSLGQASSEAASRLEELERENRRLGEKVRKLQETQTGESKSLRLVELEKTSLEHERSQLKSTLDTVKENFDRQLEEMSADNEKLNETLALLRARSQTTSDARLREVEQENTKLHQTTHQTSARLTKVEYENRQLTKTLERAQEAASRVEEVEEEAERLLRTKRDLDSQLASESERAQELERTVFRLEAELSRLSEAQHRAMTSRDSRESEVSELRRDLARVREEGGAAKVAAEMDRDSWRGRCEEAERRVEGERERRTRLERDMLDMDTENQKLQRQLESANNKLEALQAEFSKSEEEMYKLHSTIEQLRLSTRRLEEADKLRDRIKADNITLTNDKEALDRENRRLRQSMTAKEKIVDQLSNRVAELEQSNESLTISLATSNGNRSGRHMNGSKGDSEDNDEMWEERAREMEREVRELVEQLSVEKKTHAALREELVNAKIRVQQLTNERDQMVDDLDKVGLNREKLQMAQHESIDQKYQALESLLEQTVKEAADKQQTKIVSLTERLDESKSRNLKLSSDLSRVTRELEGLKQRYEEEIEAANGPGNSPKISSSSSSKHIMQLKDRLVELERQNAKFESESERWCTENSSLKDRLEEVEARKNRLEDQISHLQQRNADHLSQNACLQVENTTSKSQVEALQTHNSKLQDQYNQLEAENNRVASRLESAQSCQKNLVADHEQLTRLHERLSTDYERLSGEAARLRATERSLQREVQERKTETQSLKKDMDSVKHLREALEREKDQLKGESRAYVTMEEDLARLKSERAQLLISVERAEAELRSLKGDHRSLRQDHSQLTAKYEQSLVDLTQSREFATQVDLEAAKLTNKCETLLHANHKLEEEKRALLLQLQSLLNQNQDLLTQTLESKEHHHHEEMTLRDRLTGLQRQKERLEEKIMDQYKSYPSPKKNRGFGSNFMRKAKGLMAKRRESKENLKDIGIEENDNTSAISSEDISQENEDRYGDLDASFADSDVTELDCSGPVPHLRVVSQTSTESPRLMAGSMSIYDRSPGESDTSELHQFLIGLNNKKKDQDHTTDEDAEAGFGQEWRSQRLHGDSRTPNSRPLVSPGADFSAPSDPIGSTVPRPHSVTPGGNGRRQLPTTPAGMAAIDGGTNQPRAPTRTTSRQPAIGSRCVSVPAERMMPRSTSAQAGLSHHNQPQLPSSGGQQSIPPPPARKASLPVTDRCEKSMHSAPNNSSGATISGIPSPTGTISHSSLSQSSGRGVHANSPNALPESASSRVIMNRLARVGSGVSSGLPQRPATAIDFIRNKQDQRGESGHAPRLDNGDRSVSRASLSTSNHNSTGHTSGTIPGRVTPVVGSTGIVDVTGPRPRSTDIRGSQPSSSTHHTTPSGHQILRTSHTSSSPKTSTPSSSGGFSASHNTSQPRDQSYHNTNIPPVPRRGSSQAAGPPGRGSGGSPSSSDSIPPPPPRGESQKSGGGGETAPKDPLTGKPAIWYDYGNV